MKLTPAGGEGGSPGRDTPKDHGGGGGRGPGTVIFFRYPTSESLSLVEPLPESLEESSNTRLFFDRPAGGLMPTRSAVLQIRS